MAPSFHLGPAEYVRRANDETVVYALFEDVAGVDEIEAICQVPGIDGMAVGVYDLAASMGHPGEPWRDEVQAVVERVLQTCRRSRMPFGTVPRDRADLGRQIERGCQLITVATIEWGIQATRDPSPSSRPGVRGREHSASAGPPHFLERVDDLPVVLHVHDGPALLHRFV